MLPEAVKSGLLDTIQRLSGTILTVQAGSRYVHFRPLVCMEHKLFWFECHDVGLSITFWIGIVSGCQET